MSAKQILIVDDDRNIQSMLRLCLAAPQYEIWIASDGAQALVMITHELPNLVLLDLAMPVMDGMTALMHIHDLPPTSRPRVIVMTAHGSVRAAIQAIRLGSEDFLEKPFTPDDVRLSVASVLDDSGSPRAGDESDFSGVLRSVRQALRAGTLSAAETLLMARRHHRRRRSSLPEPCWRPARVCAGVPKCIAFLSESRGQG